MRKIILLFLLLSTAAFSQVYYFTGQIDRRLPVTLRLRVEDGRLQGQYRYGDNVDELRLEGTLEPEDFSGPKVKVWALEEYAGESWSGSWKGQFNGRSFQGTRQDRIRQRSFFLELVALEVEERVQFSQSIFSSVTYPRFIHPDYLHWNQVIREDFLSYTQSFQEGIVEILRDRDQWPIAGLGTDLTVSFPSLSKERIALAGYGSEFTGGSRGRHMIITSNAILENREVVRIPLEELIGYSDGVPQVLEAYLLSSLREQGAVAVEEGRIRDLKADDLRRFVIHEDGVKFHFPPESVGGYAQGAFQVYVPKTLIRLYD